MTIQDVARYLGLSETILCSIDKKCLQKNFGKPSLRDLKILAIDEISVGRRHQFLTVVINWETAAIVFVGNGKNDNGLKPFWKPVHSSHAEFQPLATFMSSAYYAGERQADKTSIQMGSRIFRTRGKLPGMTSWSRFRECFFYERRR